MAYDYFVRVSESMKLSSCFGSFMFDFSCIFLLKQECR